MPRPRRNTTSYFDTPEIDATHLLGYVLDDETPEMIEKKFQRLEEFQQTEAAPEEAEEAAGLTATDAKKLFKLTSTFSSRQFAADWSGDAVDMLVVDGPDDEDEFFGEADDDFWGELVGQGKRKRSSGGGSRSKADIEARKQAREAAKKEREREKHREKIKFIQAQLTDADGCVYVYRKRVKVLHPLTVQYTKIPNAPLPASWGKTIQPYDPNYGQLPAGTCEYHTVPSILDFDLTTLRGNFLGILMNPPWHVGAGPAPPGTVSPADLRRLSLGPGVIGDGFIFIWIAKEVMAEVFDVLEAWGFSYVENLCWVKQTVNNKFATEPYHYFAKSKETLFFFRRSTGESIELRHQRSPDVVFDFARRPGDASKPEATYATIETLLPTAQFSPETGRGRLLELWGRRGRSRPGWTTLAE